MENEKVNQSFSAGFSRTLAILMVFMGLNACAFAPGMHTQTDLWQEHGPETIPAPGIIDGDIEGFIEITPINGAVIDALNKTEIKNKPSHIPSALLTAPTDQTYRIGIDDVLSVMVWGQPGLLSAESEKGLPLVARQVKSDGTIFFPYAGVVNVRGKTRQEIRRLLTRKLSAYFRNPQIDVGVEQYNSQNVVLSGAFNTPTRIALRGAPLTLEQAIIIAKGITESADTQNLRIVRNGNIYHLNYQRLLADSALRRITLRNGDTVHMPLNRSKAYIVGEVGSPQILPLQAGGLTLTDALGSAGGLSPVSSNADQVYVIRGVAGSDPKPKVFRLSAKSPTAFLLASGFNLQSQDVIFVGASDLTRWNRVISQLFPSTNLFRTTQSLVE